MNRREFLCSWFAQSGGGCSHDQDNDAQLGTLGQMIPENKISRGVRMLREQGHEVESSIRHGKLWWEIDRRMLASDEEIDQIADGIYSLAELEELFIKRRKEELGQL